MGIVKHAVLGLRVALRIPGEEIGWDDDRGRPEAVTEDREVIGRISKIGRIQPNGDQQVRVSFEGDAPDEIVDEWGWLSNCEVAR